MVTTPCTDTVSHPSDYGELIARRVSGIAVLRVTILLSADNGVRERLKGDRRRQPARAARRSVVNSRKDTHACVSRHHASQNDHRITRIAAIVRKFEVFSFKIH